jgi:glycosyltransferase involved in cell wall biosynthesis
VRAALGLDDHDVVCVYTGRFNAHKNPRLLADAVTSLRRDGLPFRGLFIGGGEQADYLSTSEGSIVHGYVAADQLADLYVASDVAVWPRSYSASQVEAAACGLPVVITDTSQKRSFARLRSLP